MIVKVKKSDIIKDSKKLTRSDTMTLKQLGENMQIEQTTKLVDQIASCMKDGNDDQNKKEIVKRTSIANQGVVSNYRKLQREAMRLAKSDVNNIPD